MKTLQFQELLAETACHAMACNGEFDAKELDEIEKFSNEEIYFMDFNMKEFQTDFVRSFNSDKRIDNANYLSKLKELTLTVQQKHILIEVLLRVISADGELDEQEEAFLKIVIDNLGLPIIDLMEKFPSHIRYFVDDFDTQVNTD